MEKFVEVPHEVVVEKIVEVEVFVDKPVYIENIVEEETEYAVNGNEKYHKEMQKGQVTMSQLGVEYSQLMQELERVKLTYKMGEMNAHVTEQTIGYEDNR